MSTKKASKKTVKKVEAPEKEVTTEPEEKAPEVKEEPKAEKDVVIGSLKGGKDVHQKNTYVKVKSVRGPIHKRELPEDIQKWLTNKGYGTNVYLESKEWLEKHNVDPVMLEKLKKFINDRYL